MRSHGTPGVTAALLVSTLLVAACGGGSTEPITVVKDSAGAVSFTGTVLPILRDHCKRCHDEDRKGGLYLMSYDGVRKGGKRGPAVIAGDPEGSQIVGSVEKRKEPHMPPRVFSALTEDRIAAIRQWIAEGAKNN
ncbi:MAG: hypothetical protein PHU25_20040 [Deltaproteobacteria bacterium]|nr:hypothetical protein [Deltaproteobacteria bacterium]